MSIKIMHILSSNHYSGAENVVCQIINMFRKDKDVEMVYCSPDGNIRKALEERQVSYFPISKMTFWQVRNAIKSYQPDIIHAHDVKASVLAALVQDKAMKVSHIHANHDSMNHLNLKTLLYYLCSGLFKQIFWVSNSALEQYKFSNRLKEKSQVLYNTIDQNSLVTKANLDNNTYAYDCVYLGRLTYQKHPQRLINVFSLAVKNHPQCKIAIIGDGDLYEETKLLATELGLNQNIHFLGFQSNPYKLLQSAKVMVMTSRYEGTPMCALEAMALGVPIVSTPTDGLKDVVEDGKTGFLSEQDEVLADRIVELVVNDDLYHKISEQAKLRFQKINNLTDYKSTLIKAYNRRV